MILGKPAKRQELWDELRHDYEIEGEPDDIDLYKKRLRSVIRPHLP